MENPTESIPSGAPKPGSVIGVAVGFLVVAGCIAALFLYGSRTFAAREALTDSFVVGAFPNELELDEDAYLLPGGERVYVIRDGAAVWDESEIEELFSSEEGFTQESESAEGEGTSELEASPEDEGLEEVEESEESSEGSENDEFEPYDWANIEVLSTDSAPQCLYLVQFPVGQAASVIRGQFQNLDWKQLSLIDAEGGRSAVDGGKLSWAGYGADFVRERNFVRGGGFWDVVRVNLSVGGECWVAYATWPSGHAGSSESVELLLEGLQPVE